MARAIVAWLVFEMCGVLTAYAQIALPPVVAEDAAEIFPSESLRVAQQQPLDYALEADDGTDDVQNAPGAYDDDEEYRGIAPIFPSYYFNPAYYNTPEIGARALPDYAPPGYETRDYQDAPGEPEYSRITTPSQRAGAGGNYVTAGMFPGSYLVPGTNTSFRFRGFVRLAALGDFDPIGSTDSFVPNTIPVPQQEGRNFNMSGRISRFATEGQHA